MKTPRAAPALAALGAGLYVVYTADGPWSLVRTVYAALLFTAFAKVMLSLVPARRLPALRMSGPYVSLGPERRPRVSVAVPCFNEDPGLLTECLRSIAAQTRIPEHVHVVDDGSAEGSTVVVANLFKKVFDKLGVEFTFTRHETNQGKRAALATAFTADAKADIYVGVDSDTVLEVHALEEALKPFADPSVTCVTGLVLASNVRRNFLTRLIDVRYANAFLYERAAYSAFGSVLCACGSLALYKASVVRANLDDFLHQMFLGTRAEFGDDRRLTNYCLVQGRVVLQPSARAFTAVPERMSHWIRQQNRWNKSFFRESVWVVQQMPFRHPAFWFTLFELAGWIVFTGMLFIALAMRPSVLRILGFYSLYVSGLSYLRAFRYLQSRDDIGVAERVLGVMLSPVYTILHLALLLPLRFFSLATLRRGGWGTRAVVEVRAA